MIDWLDPSYRLNLPLHPLADAALEAVLDHEIHARPLMETLHARSHRGTAKAAGTGGARFQLRVDPKSDPLPVELTDLTPRVDGQDVVLRWATAAETNNAGFSVEPQPLRDSSASPRPGEWTRQEFLEGAGTTETGQTYRYRVQDLEYGRHAFRLRQVDTDGTSSHSDVVETNIRLDQGHAVGKPYPNPVQEQARLAVTVRESQSVRVELYDVLGRRLRTIHRGQLDGHKTRRVRVGTQALASGLYFLRVKGDGFTETRRFTVVR